MKKLDLKVGDKIAGIHYPSTLEVLSLELPLIKMKVLEDEECPDNIGDVFGLDPDLLTTLYYYKIKDPTAKIIEQFENSKVFVGVYKHHDNTYSIRSYQKEIGVYTVHHKTTNDEKPYEILEQAYEWADELAKAPLQKMTDDELEKIVLNRKLSVEQRAEAVRELDSREGYSPVPGMSALEIIKDYTNEDES